MMTFVQLFEACNQDSSAVLVILNDVLRRRKDVMPHFQSIYPRQYKAGCYHCALTRLQRVVSFVKNVRYGEEGVKVWRSYKIGRGKFIPWSKFHVPDQDEVPTLECSAASENIKANFVPIKPRRAEVAKTSQKHQDSTDEGTDDSSEESRDSTTKIFFSARKRVALSPINAIRHYRSISNVGDTNMFLNMKLFMTAPC